MGFEAVACATEGVTAVAGSPMRPGAIVVLVLEMRGLKLDSENVFGVLGGKG